MGFHSPSLKKAGYFLGGFPRGIGEVPLGSDERSGLSFPTFRLAS